MATLYNHGEQKCMSECTCQTFNVVGLQHQKTSWGSSPVSQEQKGYSRCRITKPDHTCIGIIHTLVISYVFWCLNRKLFYAAFKGAADGISSIHYLPCLFNHVILSAGVSRISYWPADSEISLLSDRSSAASSRLQEATLDAVAAERLKSSSRPHICVLLQPLASSMLQFVEETSCNSDFLGRMAADVPNLDVQELFSRERWRSWDSFSKRFLIDDVEVHRELLGKMNLENFRTEPYFSELRQHMRDLIRILASVAASVPVLEHEYGFYETEPTASGHRTLSQDVVRHCIIQAALLAYRTGELSLQLLQE